MTTTCRLCTRTVKKNGCINLRLCHRCYQAMHYWRNRSVSDLFKRIDNLKLYQKRMRVFIGGRTANTVKRRAG